MGLVARALESPGGSADSAPGAVAQRLFSLTYQGLAKTLRFDDTHALALQPDAVYFLYQVKDGSFRFLGRYDRVS
ncbi:hypothetical protein [Streptomyces sp. NPDC017673]|uniref:hypothetical protein n=1 Tax=unclassified Streptomyces TaxID=2593676 RepID=UPI0037A96E6F